MDVAVAKLDLAALEPSHRTVFEGQQAALEALRVEVAALTERNRHLEEHAPGRW